MDKFDKKTRSWIMAQVRSTGARSTEQRLLAVLREQHITGWRRNYPLPGKPDFVFPKSKLAIFVDGCFWHGHPTRCRMPMTNQEYWEGKIHRNIQRDRTVTRILRNKGWKVLRIWEHEVKGATTLRRLRKALSDGK
ncbi:MAG: very short patch repair endonuclease [Verrucomicrobiae bacterium]|nr:very short patch repair endonuclease [Verrucomicrobiae bacterium]